MSDKYLDTCCLRDALWWQKNNVQYVEDWLDTDWCVPNTREHYRHLLNVGVVDIFRYFIETFVSSGIL